MLLDEHVVDAIRDLACSVDCRRHYRRLSAVWTFHPQTTAGSSSGDCLATIGASKGERHRSISRQAGRVTTSSAGTAAEETLYPEETNAPPVCSTWFGSATRRAQAAGLWSTALMKPYLSTPDLKRISRGLLRDRATFFLYSELLTRDLLIVEVIVEVNCLRVHPRYRITAKGIPYAIFDLEVGVAF
jgi:hypothetical protein